MVTRSGGRSCRRRASCSPRIGRECDVVTYLGEYTLQRLSAACGPDTHFERLPSGVDTTAFSPDADGAAIRSRYGLPAGRSWSASAGWWPAKGRTC